MEVDTAEQLGESVEITETTETPANKEPGPESNKFRGCGFRGRGRSGQMGRGGRSGYGTMLKSFGSPGQGRGRSRDGFMNGFGPIRRGIGRPQPYPDMRGRKGRGHSMGMGIRPPPPMHLRGPPPHLCTAFPECQSCVWHGPPPPPPPGNPGFRVPPLPHRAWGMMLKSSSRHFLPRGYHNGPPSLPPICPQAGVSAGQDPQVAGGFKATLNQN